ncbi:unnamed protein product [Peronospora belbahrii]|uniref:Uncharacterized protein n=1 Tax=Peronospora belbahrii TaxID=622444 RepID=A0ABN8DBV3_9STRA|nr:unnamed protein product [Peronospora belbahrii]
MSPMAGSRRHSSTGFSRQARASPGREASPARSPCAAAVVEVASAHERGLANEDKIIAMLDAPEREPPARAPIVRAPTPSQEKLPFHSLGPQLPALPPQPQQMRARAPAAVSAQMPATAEEYAAGAYAAAKPPRYGYQQMHVGTTAARQRKLIVAKA